MSHNTIFNDAMPSWSGGECIQRAFQKGFEFQVSSTGGPRYMREIGTPKIGSPITNSHI